MTDKRLLAGLAAIVVAALILSGIATTDRMTWLLEVAPVLIALPLLAATAKTFPLSPLLYVLITLHALVLILGGTYTYAEVPLGYWLQELFGLERNPYDKIGHFMQGFVPALIAREILLRGEYVAKGAMLGFLSGCVALSISALYELVEWWAALAFGDGAYAFLGTQGDPWDTQSDMLFALCGAVVALLLLARRQDRQIARLSQG